MKYISFNSSQFGYVKQMDPTKEGGKHFCFVKIELNGNLNISVFGTSIFYDGKFGSFKHIVDLERQYEVYNRETKNVNKITGLELYELIKMDKDNKGEDKTYNVWTYESDSSKAKQIKKTPEQFK